MTVIWWIIVITFVSGVGGTGLGGLIGSLAKRDSSRMVSLFLSFAGGVMLSVVCFDLIPEALDLIDNGNSSSLFLVMGGVLLGYEVVHILNQTIDRRRKGRGLYVAGIIMACAIALHNFPEGIVIGVSYTGATNMMDRAGLIMAIVIGLHNIPEGMAVSVPLISGGMGRGKAVLITAISGLPTIMGAILGYTFGGLGPFALCITLSFAAGAMLYVVFGELIPEAFYMWQSKVPAFTILIGILVGLLVIYA